MDRLELVERLAALSGDLAPERGVSSEQLVELRTLIARQLVETRATVVAAAGTPDRLDRLDAGSIADELRTSLELAADRAIAEIAEAPSHVRVVRRSLPFRTTLDLAAIDDATRGRAPDRTIGPFRDRDGRLSWFDIFVPIRQISIARAPGASPFLTLPLQGFLIGPSTDYVLPAGSVWIASQALTPAAPAAGFCGLRIKGGRLHFSSAPTVAGLTLTTVASARVTLELVLDPRVPAPPAAEPGKDAIAASVDVPAHVTFVFTATGGALRAADAATMKAWGTGIALERKNVAAAYEPTIAHVIFPFTPSPGDFEAKVSQSPLCTLSGAAKIARAGWALPVTVAPPAQLGAAAGAGALALFTEPGLRADWRGRKGPLVALGTSVLLGEPDRLAVLALQGKGAGSTETLRLWVTDGPQAELRLRFDRVRVLYESLAGQLDALLVSGALEAAADRPVAVNGRPFALRAKDALAIFWDTAAASAVLVEAALTPPAASKLTAIAIRNALATVQPPTLLVLAGTRTAPDAEQVQAGTLSVLYPLVRLTFTLPDPYVTNQVLPNRFSSGVAGAAASVQAVSQLVSRVQWPTPDAPTLSLLLNLGATTAASSVADAAPPSAAEPIPAVTFVSMPVINRAAIIRGQLPDPITSGQEDQQAIQQLRGIFEETAGNTREGLSLVDVSSNIDQLGVAWGFRRVDVQGAPTVPLQIVGLDLISPGANSRVFLLPQFQWEPMRNLPNPNIGFFPDRLVSGDDGGPTLFGSNTVKLVPITPDAVLDNMVGEFHSLLHGRSIGARFTLPSGIVAAASLTPNRLFVDRWAGVNIVRPATPNLRGGYQISVTAHARVTGPTVQSPFLTGASWQTRNGVDPNTGAPNGFSALRGDILNEGVEKFYNEEMGPGSLNRRVPVTRVDFAGYGATAFSKWLNPNAVATVSQVRFDVFVARTAYEVVQVASVLYPWAVPVVRTITIERKREANVTRADSGWVATGAGLYRYPPTDPAILPPPPPEWSDILTHAGVVKGAFNVRRIRETGRVVERTFGTEKIELLEVRFDADMQIEGVVAGQITGTDLVPSIDQIGYVQRSPKGHTLVPQHLAAIMADEGAMGGPVNCEIEIGSSGQLMHVVRVDVDASTPAGGSAPQFAAAARGALALPTDGASWSVARRSTAADEFSPVDPIAGTPLIREGVAAPPGVPSPFYRVADPRDLLVEASPSLEFALLQTSDGHQFLFPRPRIGTGTTRFTSTERPLLADAYARSTTAGLFPKRSSCFQGPAGSELQLVAGGKYRLGPSTSATFDNISGGVRDLIDGDALAIRAHYSGPVKYTLDPALPQAWSLAISAIRSSLDLGPFTDLMGVEHDYQIVAGQIAQLLNPKQVYAPILDPVVKIVQFLTDLLGIDKIFELLAVQGSFKFQATAQYPIEGPGHDYFDFGALKIKGKLQAGFGWSEKDHWFGFFGVDLGLKVIVLPPIFANGKTSISLKGTELAGQEIKIRVMWGASVEAKLGPLGVSAEFNYGIEVIAADSGAWQIGLLVQVIGKADIFIVKVAIKIELMAAIKRLPPPDEKVNAIGQAKFAAEVEICWFLTISVEYDIQYEADLDI